MPSLPPLLDELRVFVLGDSSVWGTLLQPHETLVGQLNAAGLHCQGRPVRFYNLGYPTLSLSKDLMLLEEAMKYQPDMVLWLVTLESFPLERQLDSPIAANNPVRMQALQARYSLEFGAETLPQPTFWQQTIIGQRRALADLFRLQLYGVLWSATGIDQAYPETYTPAQRDLSEDEAYYGFSPADGLQAQHLGFELLEAGQRITGETPLLLVNEPILISQVRTVTSATTSTIHVGRMTRIESCCRVMQMLPRSNMRICGMQYRKASLPTVPSI
jgi:hypothetical protein